MGGVWRAVVFFILFFFLFFGKQRPVHRPLFLFLNSRSGSVKILKFVALLRQCFGKIC